MSIQFENELSNCQDKELSGTYINQDQIKLDDTDYDDNDNN